LDQTISIVGFDPDGGRRLATTAADELVLLLECDRPDAGSSCHRLVDIHEVVIGRGNRRRYARDDRQLVLDVPDSRISKVHAFLRREGSSYYLCDANSKNGVTVNRARVQERRLLRDGDVIECGHTFFLFRSSRIRSTEEFFDVDYGIVDRARLPGMLTLHEPLAAQLRALRDVACSSVPVLVLGPSGSGKELIARAVHALSQRQGSFVGVNCAALPEELLAAELFGSRRGAFTGATEDRMGLIRSSDRGTMFLDEIGDLSLRAQPTFLRTLQEREVMPVGATRAIPVDLRLVAATHQDLDTLVASHQFRADLLARISGFIVRLPPLRERIEDLGILIGHLLTRHGPPGKPVPKVSVEAMRAILWHKWPLNVREIEQCLRTAIARSPERIDADHLPDNVRTPAESCEPQSHVLAPKPPSMPPPVPAPAPRAPLKLTPEQLARCDAVRTLLIEHRGNISQVARALGKDRVQIRRWIRQFGLSVKEFSGYELDHRRRSAPEPPRGGEWIRGSQVTGK
jgi:DNA-binding NtrC family response regulator